MTGIDIAAPRSGSLVPGAATPPLTTLGTLVLAALVTVLPVLVHLTGQAFGILTCVALALIVANYAAAAVPAVLIFSCLFQNLFIALISPWISSLEQFNAIRGYSFILTAATWIVVAGSYWLDRASFDPRIRSLVNVTTLTLVLAGIYFAVGAVHNPSAAIVYLRNIATPFLMFQIFVVVAYRYRVSITGSLLLMAIAALLFGYLELFADETLFRLIHGDVYLKWRMTQEYESGAWLKTLQETGRVYRSYLDAMEIDFMNTPWLAELGLRFHRLVGPNFHPISFAYALAVLMVVLVAAGHRWVALPTLPLLLVIGSKGALLLVISVTAALLAFRRWRGFGPLWLYAALLAVYAAIAIVLGIKAQDYHVIGFIGGINGFLKNPLGHGIGVGGNLSLDMTTIDWSRSQNLGSTDVAVESAVGVLLYQMGLAGALLLAVLGWIVVRLWRFYLATGWPVLAAAALGLLTVTVNGLFQEEALFSPLALALMLSLSGLLLGRGYRTQPVYHD
jgi:hypothetical protein